VIKQDISENRAKFIYLGIGSNLGKRKYNIEKAKFRLIQNKIKIIQSSNYYESISWPNPKHPKYLNIILKILTDYSPLRLLQICKSIEKELGRKKSSKNFPRICDIDIIDYNKKRSTKGIFLPHPRMHKRNFVLLPLFELDKNWKHPALKRDIKTFLSLLTSRDIRTIKQI
tara:strand:+ start:442 stop:954 length:513 start_codon:yes stop_codon:yes gene_type:complete